MKVTDTDNECDIQNYDVCGRTWKHISSNENVDFQKLYKNETLSTKSENVETIDQCFHLFFDKEILNTLILHTNEKGNASVGLNKKWKPVDLTEINAFLGLMLFIGCFRESRERANTIYGGKTQHLVDQFIQL